MYCNTHDSDGDGRGGSHECVWEGRGVWGCAEAGEVEARGMMESCTCSPEVWTGSSWSWRIPKTDWNHKEHKEMDQVVNEAEVPENQVNVGLRTLEALWRRSSPHGAHGQMPVWAGGVLPAARVDKGHQRVGRGANDGLQVHAGVGQGRDGQRTLLTQLQHGARGRETRRCRTERKNDHIHFCS